MRRCEMVYTRETDDIVDDLKRRKVSENWDKKEVKRAGSGGDVT